jgi:hypothetical protein
MSQNVEKQKPCCAPVIQSVENGIPCCAPPFGQRMLNFPDGTQCGVIGLDGILAEVYSEGRQVNEQTAEEIIDRLEAKKNYIPLSDSVRKEYSYVLLKEYSNHIERKKPKPSR